MNVDHWTPKDYQQLADLTALWSNGTHIPVDVRCLSHKVKKWAVQHGLIERDKRYVTTDSHRFMPVFELPIEVLWLMIEPMITIGDSIGMRIENDRGWLKLNICPANYPHHQANDLVLMQKILLELDLHHYIYYQTAGSVWRIQRRKR